MADELTPQEKQEAIDLLREEKKDLATSIGLMKQRNKAMEGVIDVEKEGKLIRYSDDFRENGVNVNFVQKISDEVFKIRTYERGVEYETMACGTGSTASALCMNYLGKTTKNEIKMKCIGGDLIIKFHEKDKEYSKITHVGPAQEVFKGSFVI